MDVTTLPFNRFLGLEAAASGGGFLVSLRGSPEYTNHLGTVHASVLLAVAEAGSGAFLAGHLGDASGYLPVVRRVDAKFRRPAQGRVSARVTMEPACLDSVLAELRSRSRVLVEVPTEVVDESGVVVLSAKIEWFIGRLEERA